jgi:Sulfotransferase family
MRKGNGRRSIADGRTPSAGGRTPQVKRNCPTPSVPRGTVAEGAGVGRQDGPIVVLSYPHSGAQTLTRLLSTSRNLACTSGTGIILLCHAALAAWQEAEGSGQPSVLAIKLVRALAVQMITIIQAVSGASRWCETAFTAPAAADMFLQVFPAATFVCLHRSLPAVIAEGISAYPWGLGTSPFWAYAGQHPGNSAATITAYWTACTEQLLDFESAHPTHCLRTRHEDLTADGGTLASRIYTRLGLDPSNLPALSRSPSASGHDRSQPEHDHQLPLPVEQIPPRLLAKVTGLHTRLGYPPRSPDWRYFGHPAAAMCPFHRQTALTEKVSAPVSADPWGRPGQP